MSPVSEETALLDAIRLHHDEDTPRLVYADWLEEHDQADRAAFIRLQCEAARLPPGEESSAKATQADKLLKANRLAWFGPLWKAFRLSNPAVRQGTFDRGFVTSLASSASDFIKHSDAIARFAPCLRTITPLAAQKKLGRLLAKPFIRSIAELNLDLEPDDVQVFNELPAWGSFDALRLEVSFENAEDSLEGLPDAPLVQAAKRLEVKYGYFLDEDDDADGRPAAQEPSLREMHRLKIPHLRGFGINNIDADSAREVTRWPGFKRLDCLDFGICCLEEDAILALLTSKNLPKLATLRLNENMGEKRTAKAIAECPKLTELKLLTLSWLSLTDADANRLIASKYLPAKLAMEVSYCGFSKRALARLRERFGPDVESFEL
jgi:uncharacterized protein (TIGR02996 family)